MSEGILVGDCREQLKTLPDESVHCAITSPPYFGLRSYLPDDHPDKGKEIGIEGELQSYIDNLVEVFREVRRVLRDDGTLWLNLGDSYAGSGKGQWKAHGSSSTAKERYRPNRGETGKPGQTYGLKPKDLIGVPWRVALALQADGWYLRDCIIWAKGMSGKVRMGSVMPSSVKDRTCTAHEYVFMLSKKPKYHYDIDAIKETMVTPGATENTGVWTSDKQGGVKNEGHENATYRGGVRNRNPGYFGSPTGATMRSVWHIGTKPFKEAHFATFPSDLIEPMVKAGCPEGGTVLDPFLGAGTVGLVAESLGRSWIGCELSQEYADMAQARIAAARPLNQNLSTYMEQP